MPGVVTSATGKRIYKARASGQIVFHANAAVVLRDDAARDRKAEAGAALLRREVRQKKAFFVFRRNSVARCRRLRSPRFRARRPMRVATAQPGESSNLPSIPRRYRSDSPPRASEVRGPLGPRRQLGGEISFQRDAFEPGRGTVARRFRRSYSDLRRRGARKGSARIGRNASTSDSSVRNFALDQARRNRRRGVRGRLARPRRSRSR